MARTACNQKKKTGGSGLSSKKSAPYLQALVFRICEHLLFLSSFFFPCCTVLPLGMAQSPSTYWSTTPSMLRRRGPCRGSERSRSSSASRCVLSLMLPVVLLLLRGGSVESATQVGAGAGAGAGKAHRRFAGPAVPGIAAVGERVSAAGDENKSEADRCRRSRAQSTSFVAKDDRDRLHMPRIGGIRRPDWLVSGPWSIAMRSGS